MKESTKINMYNHFGELCCFFNNSTACYRSCLDECPSYYDIIKYEEIQTEVDELERTLEEKNKQLEKLKNKIFESYSGKEFQEWLKKSKDT